MNNTGTVTYESMRPRARAAADVIELHYRAEFANALLSGELPPPAPRGKGAPTPPKGTKPVVARLMEYVGEANRKQRRGMLKHLLSGPIGGRPLTPAEQNWLEKMARSSSKTPMAERTKVVDKLTEILSPGKEFDLEKPSGILGWQHGILRDVIPTLTPYDDGRPDDAEPGKPTGGEDAPPQDVLYPGAPDLLSLSVATQRVTCVDDTNELGRDEILFSGIAFDGPLQETNAPQPSSAELMRLYDAGQFSQGDSRDFSERGAMHTYDLTGLTAPHIFFAVFVVAEEDESGGFRNLLSRLMLDLMAEMRGFWAILLGTVAGSTAIGAAFGALLGPIGILAIGILGLLYGLFAGALFAYGLDDVFPPSVQFLEVQPNAINLPPFNGNLVSDELSLTVSDFGGEYRLDYHWEFEINPGSPGDWDSDQPV